MKNLLLIAIIGIAFSFTGHARAQKTGETYAVAIKKGDITSTITSTGETIDTVANVDLHNNTSNPISVTIPATVLVPTDGSSQSYAVPKPTTVSVPPGETKTVPLNGVCTMAHRLPVAKGNENGIVIKDPTAPDFQKTYGSQLQCVQNVMLAVKEEQATGQIHTPLSSNPKKEFNSIVQQTVWAANPAHDGAPTTKADLTKTVDKQAGATTDEQKKALQPGIDQIWNAVELTGVKAKVLTPDSST